MNIKDLQLFIKHCEENDVEPTWFNFKKECEECD